MTNNKVYLGLLVLGTAFWGISFPLVKEGLSVVEPHIFLIYRFFMAAVVLTVIFFKYLSYIDMKTLKLGALLAIPLIGAIMLQTFCLKYTSSSNASFIAGMDILFIPIFKFFFFKKKIPLKTWIACLIAISGLYIIAMSATSGFGFGDILALIGAVSFAIYIIMVARYGEDEKIKTPSLMLVQMYACVFYCIVVALFFSSPSELIIPMDIHVWKAILFTGILATAFMYTIQNISQKYIGEEKIAMIYLCEPIFATVAGYLLISEEITSRTIIGGGLILFALFIAEYKFKTATVFKKKYSNL